MPIGRPRRPMAEGLPEHELAVRAIAGASANTIAGERGGALVVRVSAPPERGRANVAICRLLADRLGLAASAVWVVRGQASTRKVVRVRGIAAPALEEQLGVRVR
ncbi:MAG TPA: DUF167 domain-containing protein [Solirubrobacteraceae bacterium]|nr:DUF167 domain-containing protein [Solirubrobacteraceae bacterium]